MTTTTTQATQPTNPTTPAADATAVSVDRLMTTRDVADFLQINPNTLEQWRVRGRGPDFVRVGSRVRYRREDVEAWLRERGGGVMDPVEPAPEVGAIICALRAMHTRNDVDEWTVQRAAELLLELGTRPAGVVTGEVS